MQRGKAKELIFSAGKDLAEDRKGRNTNYLYCLIVLIVVPHAFW